MRLPHVLLFSSIFNFGSPEGLLPEGLRCSRPERLPEEIGVASTSVSEPSRSVNLRILHGQETKWNWPFIVRLGMRDSNGIIRLCGGTILNQRWIITGTGSLQGQKNSIFLHKIAKIRPLKSCKLRLWTRSRWSDRFGRDQREDRRVRDSQFCARRLLPHRFQAGRKSNGRCCDDRARKRFRTE